MANTWNKPTADRERETKTALRAARPTPALRLGLPIGLYLVLAVMEFSPLSPFDRTRLPNGAVGDPTQMVWFLAYTPWALLHGHNPFLTSYLDYPGGVNLASNTAVPLLGVLLAPITLTLGPIAALNVALRLALFASATAMFFVLRRWCHSTTAATVGGFAYGFGPYLATHLHLEAHLNLVFAPIPPLLVLLFDDAFVAQRHRAIPVGILLGVAAAAELLISPEVLSEAILLGAIALVALVVAARSTVRARLSHAIRVAAAAVLSFAVLAAWPLAEMLFGPGHLRGPLQSVTHLQSFRADLLEPFLPNANQLLAPAAAVRAAAAATRPTIRAGGSAELGGYLGIPLVVLVLVLIVVLRRDRVILALSALATAAFLLSLGNRLEVDGRITSIPLPEAVLAHLPLLDDTVPARFGLFVALFTAMVLAIGIDRVLVGELMIRGRPAPPAVVAGLAGLAVLTLVALFPRTPLVKEEPALQGAVTSTLERDVPANAVVLTYPYPDPPYDVAMLWQASAKMRFRLMGGYATVNGAASAGQYYPVLLEPSFVQEELTSVEAGRSLHYPAVDPTTDGPAALCSYLARYGVGAVVFAPIAYSPAGPGVTAVARLFTEALGAPSTSGAGLRIWLVHAASIREGDGPSSGRC